MSGGEFCHTIDSNDGILFDRLFQANNRSVSRSDTALLDSTYDHDSNDATSFDNQSHRTLIHSLQSTLHRPMETSENAQRAEGDAVLGAALAETSMPADQAAPQDSQQKGVASSIPEKMFEISKLSNALMGSIEIYLDLCEHTKKLPAAIASRSELPPDSQDLSYLRSTKNFDDIIRMYTEKIAQLDARITALQSTKPTFLKTARTVTESYEPSGPHPGPQEQLSKPPPRRIVKDLGRPRVAGILVQWQHQAKYWLTQMRFLNGVPRESRKRVSISFIHGTPVRSTMLTHRPTHRIAALRVGLGMQRDPAQQSSR